MLRRPKHSTIEVVAPKEEEEEEVILLLHNYQLVRLCAFECILLKCCDPLNCEH
jgi:hypothetical protein